METKKLLFNKEVEKINMRKWTKKCFVVALVISCVQIVSSADAVPVLQWQDNDPLTHNAIGILGLEVPAYGTYDVTFGHTFTSVWGDPSAPSPVPTFWGDEVGAGATTLAILTLFNAIGGVYNANDFTHGAKALMFVPYAELGDGIHISGYYSRRTTYEGNPDPFGVWEDVLHGGSHSFWESHASFSVATPIPEPSTIVLMTCGLLGLLGIGVKCRRKAK